MCERHAVRAFHADVPTGQRDVSQLSHPPVALVVGDQHLATPDGAIWTVTGSVKGESENVTVAVQAVFGHDGGDVGVVVLHRPDRSPVGIAARPGGGAVTGVCVGDKIRGVHSRQFPQVPLGRVECGQGGQVVHVADVLTQPRVLALGNGQRVLQVGADRQGGCDGYR